MTNPENIKIDNSVKVDIEIKSDLYDIVFDVPKEDDTKNVVLYLDIKSDSLKSKWKNWEFCQLKNKGLKFKVE